MLRGGGRLASALSFQTVQLVRRAIELPVHVSFVAREFVSCICGRQSEAPSFRVYCEILALCHVSRKLAKPFQPIVKYGKETGDFLTA